VGPERRRNRRSTGWPNLTPDADGTLTALVELLSRRQSCERIAEALVRADPRLVGPDGG
jgi:hypothetical protein